MGAERDGTPRCPNCGAAHPAGAATCPLCGASLAPPVEDLVEDLEELGTVAETQAIVEELEAVERAADEAVGELAAVEEAVARTEERLREEEADLGAFAARVAAAEPGTRLAPHPPRSRVAGPALAAGGLLGAAGLFLLPSNPIPGVFAILGGFALAAVGAVLAHASQK